MRAVVIAQLVERLLTTPQVSGSNPIISIIYIACLLSTASKFEKTKMKDKKRPGMSHFYTETCENVSISSTY